MQYLDETEDQSSWKLLADDLYADQDVWQDIDEHPPLIETMQTGSQNANSIGFFLVICPCPLNSSVGCTNADMAREG